MDDLVLQRPLDIDDEEDPIDELYGNQELQLDLHNGAVSVTFPSADAVYSFITNLNTGMEGGGNYIVFLHDKVLFISDATQLGLQQYVEIRPNLEEYQFIAHLNMTLRRTSRIILKTRFSNVKNALIKDKNVKSKKRTATIKKGRGNPNLEVLIGYDSTVSNAHNISCTLVSQLPERPDSEPSNPIWSGSVSSLLAKLADIYNNKSDHIYMYLKTNGSGIYFYAYHITAGHGARGAIGDVKDEEFRSEEKNIKLIPKNSKEYIEYKVTRKALKSLQKLPNEKADTIDMYCVSGSVLKVECLIGEDTSHIFYFSS